MKKTIRSLFTAAIAHHSSDFASQSDLRSVDTAAMFTAGSVWAV